MTAPVMDVPQMVLAHEAQLVVHEALIRRLHVALGIADSAELLVCPGCRKPVPAGPGGVLPPHQIDGALLGSGRRRTVSVCRYRPEAVA